MEHSGSKQWRPLSEKSLFCLPMSNNKEARLIFVNIPLNSCTLSGVYISHALSQNALQTWFHSNELTYILMHLRL